MTQITTVPMEVKLINSMGNDNAIVAAARVSTQGEASLQDLTSETRSGLINYLMKNRHGTPFEHGSMIFFIKAPIFVFREFHRHRIGWSYNEESGRYKQLAPEFYMPHPTNRPGLAQVEGGKPGQYEYTDATDNQYYILKDRLYDAYDIAYRNYEEMLKVGIAREVARMCLPVGIFSSMYATCNPRSLMSFLSLRTKHEDAKFPSKPQWEINWVADRMEQEFRDLFPVTYNAYVNNGRVAP